MLALLALLQSVTSAPPARRPEFARTIEALSEPGGFFWSDNLVSNETSYLHIAGKLDDLRVQGGAYVGVGPEQNFSYIARIKPAVAFIIDIRRDNLLLHLLFKAAFERAANRLQYLCIVYARQCPADVKPWTNRSLEDLIAYIDRTPRDSVFAATLEDGLIADVVGYGVPMSTDEIATLRRLHGEFISEGLDLRFSAYGRRAIPNFPTIRQLYLEHDLNGRRASYLAQEDAFRVVQDLERRDKVIPVVGDLAGPHALRAIGDYLTLANQKLTLLYVSNVEFYLFRQASFDRFVDNVRALPIDATSLITRSYFGVQTGLEHPDHSPGHLSVQLLQSAERFIARATDPRGLTYWSLVTEDLVPLVR
jgi:hypothetical protein